MPLTTGAPSVDLAQAFPDLTAYARTPCTAVLFPQ
jgi:hypothetical protein